MRILLYLLASALPAWAASSSDDSKHPHIPCTIRSPTSGAFFDLNPVRIELPEEGKTAAKGARNTSWPARGYDYGANFTLNFCSPVVEELHDVIGVDKSKWGNVGAYYEAGGKIFSLGSVATSDSDKASSLARDRGRADLGQEQQLTSRLPRPQAGTQLHGRLALPVAYVLA